MGSSLFWSGAPLCDRHRSNHNGTQVVSSSSGRGIKDFCSERGEIRRCIWRNRLLYVVFGTWNVMPPVRPIQNTKKCNDRERN